MKLFIISVMRQRKLRIKVLTGSVIPLMHSMSAAELRSVSGKLILLFKIKQFGHVQLSQFRSFLRSRLSGWSTGESVA